MIKIIRMKKRQELLKYKNKLSSTNEGFRKITGNYSAAFYFSIFRNRARFYNK
jgi:hypothetical protein